MILAECELTTEKVRGKFRVYPIGDMHADSLAFDEPRFKAYIKHIAADPCAIALSVGDYCEGRVPGKKHFDPASLIPEARQNIAEYVKWNLDRAEKLLAPLRTAKIPLFLCQGNHDLYMEYAGFTAALADRLKAKYLADAGMIRLNIKSRHSSFGTSAMTLYMTHGSGGAGLPGAKVNAMQRFTGWIDADLILAGHVHDSMVRIVPSIGVTIKRHPLRLVEREVCLIRAPSFLKRSVAGVTTYADRKGYPTSDQSLTYVESVTLGGGAHSPVRRTWKRHDFVPD